jgi:hypothetical protein
MPPIRRPVPPALCLATVALAAIGCGGDADKPPPADLAPPARVCAGDTRGDVYTPGLEKSGQAGLLVARLVAAQPAPPAIGTNTWTLDVRDAAGSPRSDLAITALPWMPDHNHGTSVKASVTPVGTAGQYTATPLYLFMAGLWQVTLKMQLPDTTTDQAVFSFCLDES